ncbi:hypothetical protein B0T22DRAFT_468831 [Podospora appendiculata]|uniref:Uncharacterized protein n=1 Tax=Podospora appendiculata TaxID=314037 RepID=A0AAE0X3F0_9PEZI|nr:hypothetical protein B0T22DRAFT_468831 [Podospora appendiculata]
MRCASVPACLTLMHAPRTCRHGNACNVSRTLISVCWQTGGTCANCPRINPYSPDLTRLTSTDSGFTWIRLPVYWGALQRTEKKSSGVGRRQGSGLEAGGQLLRRQTDGHARPRGGSPGLPAAPCCHRLTLFTDTSSREPRSLPQAWYFPCG